MPRPITAIVRAGDSFGMLTVIEAGSGAHTKIRCRCACGAETAPEIRSLRTGSSTSCGCVRSRSGNYYSAAAVAARSTAYAERRAAAAGNARRARELRAAGHTWPRIAAELSLPSGSAAFSLAHRYPDG
jgi:hypothetical protein